MKTPQQRRVVFESHCERRKRYAFSFVLNVASDMFSRKAGGRLFHTAGSLYAKLRCPVEVWTRGSRMQRVDADHSAEFVCIAGDSSYSKFNLCEISPEFWLWSRWMKKNRSSWLTQVDLDRSHKDGSGGGDIIVLVSPPFQLTASLWLW